MGQWQHGLHRALAEGLGAHNSTALPVLHGTCQNLRGAGAIAVNQHHKRIIKACQLRIVDGPVAVPVHHGHDFPGRYQLVGNLHAGSNQPSRVGTQIHDQAFHALLLQAGQLLLELLAGIFAEGCHPDIANLRVIHHNALGGSQLDNRPGNGYIEVLLPLAADSQHYLGTFLPPHLAGHFLRLHGRHILTINPDDFVLFQKPCRRAGSILHDGHNLTVPRLREAHDHANAAKGTFCLLHQLLELLIIHVNGVLIPQSPGHAVNGTIHQLLQGHLIHILILNKQHGGHQPANLRHICLIGPQQAEQPHEHARNHQHSRYQGSYNYFFHTTLPLLTNSYTGSPAHHSHAPQNGSAGRWNCL